MNPLNPNSGRILIRSVNWLGNAIMTLPALALIRQTLPSSHISLLVPQKLTDLWLDQPYADTILSFEPKEGLFTSARFIGLAKAHTALVLPNSPRSALELWLAHIPYRFGYHAKWRCAFLSEAIPYPQDHTPMGKRSIRQIRELAENQKEPQKFSYSAQAHHIYHYVHLAKHFLEYLGTKPQLPIDLTPLLKISTRKQNEVKEFFGIQSSSADSPLLGVNVGAEYGPAKRWPLENFAITMATLAKEENVRWMLFGGPSDRAQAQELRERCCTIYPETFIYQLTGRTTLNELALLANLCELFLTNDTGPMHVAAAAQTTVLTPFLSTSPELTCPGSPLNDKLHANRHILLKTSRTPCSPCFLKECPIDFRCAREFPPELVISAIRKHLGRP